MEPTLEKKSLIVCAHPVYPVVPTSEGIVTKNWLEIMQGEEVQCSLISAVTTSLVSGDNPMRLNGYLNFLWQLFNAPKKSLHGLAYGFSNKIAAKLGWLPQRISLYFYLWSGYSTKKLLLSVAHHPNTVVWARVIPSFSLLPIVGALKKRTFPLIINVNDPIENYFHEPLSLEEKMFAEIANDVQCWTFPSMALAKETAEKFNLDINRCFVIPHAMRKQETLYFGPKDKAQKLNFVYTGTFYRSAFSEAFQKDLTAFSNSEKGKGVTFTFILSQFDEYSLQWIKTTLPTAVIKTKLSREKVLEITAQADGMIVIDSKQHKALLKGKLIEAMAHGTPVFAVTYKNSVMDKVVSEYGCEPAYQDVDCDMLVKLKALTQQLKDENWCHTFFEKRKTVLEKIAENSIAKASLDIMQYAQERYFWQQGKTNSEPKPPSQYNWP